MRSAIFEISLVIAAFILVWLKTGWNALFYIALGFIAFYVVIMIIYIVTRGSTLSWLDKLLGILALAGWLGIAWVLVQEKGLHLLGL
jgi:hypothetical protein